MAKILSSNADPMTPTQLEDKVLEKYVHIACANTLKQAVHAFCPSQSHARRDYRFSNFSR